MNNREGLAEPAANGRKNALIEMKGIEKVYQMGKMQVHALREVSLTVQYGDFFAVRGASGSGKSTLLSIIGCLDRPTSGSYRLDGEEVESLSDKRLAHIRNHRIGFIFQTFNLLPRMSALENVLMPLMYGNRERNDRKKLAVNALKAVGLRNRIDHHPSELSGGEQQRVAIARALVTEPSVILADEPTGNLDSNTGKEILDILTGLHAKRRTLILITHDAGVASCAERTLWLEDGELREELIAYS